MSGYTHCTCCGEITVSDDVDRPELCLDCIDAGCSPDGSEAGSDPKCPAWPDESEEE